MVAYGVKSYVVPVIVMLPSLSLLVVTPLVPINLTVSPVCMLITVLSSAAILSLYSGGMYGLLVRLL